MPNSPAFIFDMDGVLINSEPLYIEANRQYFAQAGIDVPLEEHLKYVGASGRVMWTDLKRRYGLRENIETLIETERERIYAALCSVEHLAPIEKIPWLIDELEQAGVQLGLASSSPRRAIRLVLERLGLAARIPAVVSGEDVRAGKPAPDIFLSCAALMDASPSGCIVLEDSVNGVRAALAAGMHVIGFANPQSVSQCLDEADVVVDRIDRRIIDFVQTISRTSA